MGFNSICSWCMFTSWLALSWMNNVVACILSNYLHSHISLFLPITTRIILGLVVFLPPFHNLVKGGISPLRTWGVSALIWMIRSCCSTFCRICLLSTWNRENIHQSTEVASLRWCLLGSLAVVSSVPVVPVLSFLKALQWNRQTEYGVELLLLLERWKRDEIWNDSLENLSPSSSPIWKGRGDFQVISA